MLRWLSFLLALSGAVSAAPVNLAWDPVADSRLTGYELGWGSAAGAYSQYQPAADTTATLDLAEPGPWHIAVRAVGEYAGAQIQSGWSNEVVWGTDAVAPTQPLAQNGVWAVRHAVGGGPVMALAVRDVSAGNYDRSWSGSAWIATVPYTTQSGDVALVAVVSLTGETGSATWNGTSPSRELLVGSTDETVVQIMCWESPAIGSYNIIVSNSDVTKRVVVFAITDSAAPTYVSNASVAGWSSSGTTVTATAQTGDMILGAAVVDGTSTMSLTTGTVIETDATGTSGKMSVAYNVATSNGDLSVVWGHGTEHRAGAALLYRPSAATAATALPRRALDGPFYGALRGSVR